MSRKTALLVLALLLFPLLAEAAMPNPFRRRSASDNMFPGKGDIPGLEPLGKVLSYNLNRFKELYGSAGNRYIQYGLQGMLACDYAYGGKDRRVSIEIATMESPTAAAGLFHHHRGNVLAGNGQSIAVGAEGVLDSGRENRSLYFYRGQVFAKVIYSGKDPVPDLLPIAQFIDAKAPRGQDAKPEGFSYIEIEGINPDSVELTPGFTFNLSFLPASVSASAPGGGSVASDLFVITRNSPKEASQLYSDYVSYLKMYAEYHEEYRRDRQRFIKAVDPNQGRVVCTAYKNVFIIAARPDGYEKGEALIDKVMAKVDQLTPGRKR